MRIRRYFFDGIALIRWRRSVSMVFAWFHDSASSIFLPWMMPSNRDSTIMICKSSAVALNERRISMKSVWICCMCSGFISNSFNRISVKKRRITFSRGFKNCFTAVNVSFICGIVSVSGFKGMWQLLCGGNKKEKQFDWIYFNFFKFSSNWPRVRATHRKHALAIAKYQNRYICIVIDGIKFKIHAQLLLPYQIRNVKNCLNAGIFQFARFESSFIKYQMCMSGQL